MLAPQLWVPSCTTCLFTFFESVELSHSVALLHCLNQNFIILHTCTAFQILLLCFIFLHLTNSSTREWSYC